MAVGDALAARFSACVVQGELSGVTRAASGHCYFTLKDAEGAQASVRCAMFRRAASLLDFVPRDGLENLAQAVILRLLTPRGELAALGHPDYGSRVHELIGRENDGPRRNLLRLFILEALKAEPRIDKVAELRVEPSPGTRSTVDVLLRVKPVAATELVTIGPFSIELAV